MNVFLPYERAIVKSVQSLDDLRLNKQILECIQLLTAYVRKEINHENKVGYTNHPVYKHFTSTSYNLYALMKYAIESCIEYYNRFGQIHKLYDKACELRNSLFRYPDNIDMLYEPYFMRGSLGQPEYIRTTENVSRLFQDRLIEKWNSDKRQPLWTNRDKPEFYNKLELYILINYPKGIARDSSYYLEDLIYEYTYKINKTKKLKIWRYLITMIDCKHEEYDMEGKHCKLSHCAKGVGMRCKKDYGEWCSCYEAIDNKKKRKSKGKKFISTSSVKPVKIEEKDTYAIRKDATTNDAEFVKLLNKEVKQLVNNFFFEYVKGYCIKQSELAEDTKHYCEQKSMEMLKSDDQLNHNLHWKNAAYFDGQVIAYKNVINVLEDVLKANSVGDDIKND